MIIAEIGTSHGGSIEKAKKLIDAAADATADAVKFQWVYADEILHPKTGFVNLPTGQIPLYDRFRELECTPEFYRTMKSYAEKKGLMFTCSPFGIKSLKELLELEPAVVKIASPELNHFPMLKALAEHREKQTASGKDAVETIISSGVSKLFDIEKALSILGKEKVSLLHCITSYPAPEEEYNVMLVKTLRDIFGIETGISDHSLDPVLVPALAAAMGGIHTEKHITLSKKTEGLDDPVALEPEQFYQMSHAIRQCHAAIRHYGTERGKEEILRQMENQYGIERVRKAAGNGIKKLAESEKENYGRTNRSLHYMKSFQKGHIIQKNDIGVLRTEKILTPGLSPEYLELVMGKSLAKDVEDGAGITFEDFMN